MSAKRAGRLAKLRELDALDEAVLEEEAVAAERSGEPLSFVPFEPDPDDLVGWWRRETLRRRRILRAFRKNPRIRRWILKRCKDDVFFWFDNFAWTKDPRERSPGEKGLPRHLPFVLFDFQRVLVRYWIGELRTEDGDLWPLIIDKSRDMGATWVILGCIVWQWQFHGADFGVIARVERDVDLGDQDGVSLFGRLRYLIKRQPRLMRPKGYQKHKRDRSVDTYMQLRNPNGGVILGNSTVGDAFRQHRFQRIFVDEGASIDQLDSILRAINDVTPAPAIVSSVKGRGNTFAQIVHGERGKVVEEGGTGVGWMHLRFHYSRHPWKRQDTARGRAWYKRERARRDDEEWAQEQDIDYAASMPDRCWPEFRRELHVYSQAFWDERIEPWLWRVGATIIEAWDFGSGPSHTFVSWWAYVEATDTLYALDFASWSDEEVDEVVEDIAGLGWHCSLNPAGREPDVRVGDPAGMQRGPRSVGGRAELEAAPSWIENLEEFGIEVTGQQLGNVVTSIRRVRRKIKGSLGTTRDGAEQRRPRIVFSPACAVRKDPKRPSLVECCEGHHWEPSSVAIGRPRPAKRSEFSHGADTVQYAAAHVWGPAQVDIERAIEEEEHGRTRTAKREPKPRRRRRIHDRARAHSEAGEEVVQRRAPRERP